MTRLKLSCVLLGATALSLPLGMTAFAQQAQQQTQQPTQAQQQQGQQAATQQTTELGACEKLLRLIDEAGDEQLLAEFAQARQIAEQNDVESCTLVIKQVDQAGGISEEAVAERRGTQFLTDRETFQARDRIKQTVQIEQEAVVEGEVLVRQAIPEIGIEQQGPEIGVTPGNVDVAVQEQPAEITIRQKPASIRVEIPQPTITIEQPAPEIVLHMPPPGVSLDRQPPRVSVTLPDPNVTVAQAEPQVTANVQARFVDDDELAQLESGGQPRVKTVTERLDAAGNPVEEQKHAEVTVQKGEPKVSVQQTEQEAGVRFQQAEPRIVYQPSEPQVEVAFAKDARVSVQQVGEPTVRIVRDDQQQASAQGEQQGQQAQQAMQGQQQDQQTQQAMQGQQQGQDQQAMQGQQQDQGAVNVQVTSGEQGGLQIEQRVQAASDALDRQDLETARAEIDAANQELAMAMEQADDSQRQQLQGVSDQLALVIVALDQQDMEGARTALGDVQTNLAGTDLAMQAQGQQQAAGADGARLSPEDTNRLLAMPEDSAFGEPQLVDIQAGDLNGRDIETVRGEEVGEIDEITSNGDRLYAIIEHGGFLGLGEDHIAIPLDRIAMQGDQLILLGLSEQDLEQMPNYDFEADQAFSANQTIEIGRFE